MKSQIARHRKQEFAARNAHTGCFFMVQADAIFYEEVKPGVEGPIHRLHYVDAWTGVEQYTEFSTEVEMLKFVGEYCINDEGPTEEFMKRFPAEFKQ